MIDKPPQTAKDNPLPLWPALAAMTSLQALVALGLFAPGVLAPRLGLRVEDVGLFTTVVFAVGMSTSLYGGTRARRYGPCRVAALCAMAIAFGMTLASMAGSLWLVAAGVCVGLAFGPETPASSTLLSKLARPKQRPLIFSVRQTGNQIGAILGSLALPAIALTQPTAGYWLIAAIALLSAAMLARLGRRYDLFARGDGVSLDLITSLKLVAGRPDLRALALLSMPFSAMQLALNAFLVTFAVTILGHDHLTAGVLLASAQAGGLIGRLFWGLVATKVMSSRALLARLGLGMSAAALGMAELAPHVSYVSQAALSFLFGLTASGWNGVFLAEVARLAPAGRIAEVTGAVLTASYAGLLLGPALVTLAATAGTLSTSYAILALCTCAATIQLVRTSP